MKNYTDINIILDRSGSMRSIASDVTGGIQSFVDKQKEVYSKKLESDPDAPSDIVSLFNFDQDYDTVFVDKKISDVDSIPLEPRGWTALLDAVGRTISSVGTKLSNMEEADRPERVLFFIITDGLENKSTEYTFAQVQEMIKHQREVYAWDFVFLGTDEAGVFAQRDKLGIGSKSSASFGRNSADINASFCSLTESYADYSLLSRSDEKSRSVTFEINPSK